MTPSTIITAIIGLTLAGVSLAWSVMLWVSFADNSTDAALAGTTAGALVAAQFALLLNARSHWHKAAVTLLTLVSIAASVGWLEAGFQRNHSVNNDTQQHSNAQQQSLHDITTEIQLLQQLAAADANNNYRQRATRRLAEARTLDAERQAILNQHTSSTGAHDQSTALGNGLSHWRWLAWLLLAAIIDLVAMLCLSDAVKARLKQRTESESTAPEHPATEHIAELIRDGTRPVMRSLIGTEFNGRRLHHTDLKQIFNALEHQGVIQRNGNTWSTL